MFGVVGIPIRDRAVDVAWTALWLAPDAATHVLVAIIEVFPADAELGRCCRARLTIIAGSLTMTSFAEFEAAAKAEGADEVLERKYAPNAVIDTHTHSFAVQALVVHGELWLTCGDTVKHLQPGDRFELDREEPHAERYGPDGATFWVARRNGPA